MSIEALLINITKQFIDYWNNGDVESLKNFLKDDTIVYSPNIKLIYPENTLCKIVGKDNIIKYWVELNNKVGIYQFVLESFKKIDNEVFTVSVIEGQTEKLYTNYTYNEYGKLTELRFEYR